MKFAKKIKLAILENDQICLTRMVSYLGARYAEEFELFSFTDPEAALSTVISAKIDCLLASENFEIDATRLPKRCAFAYLVEYPNMSTLRDCAAICKFQRIDQLYKNILELLDGQDVIQDDHAQMIAFCSAAGGAGASTMAAACAMHFAKRQKKVLYLNLEKYGSSDCFFSGMGSADMSDVIFALKSKKPNLATKLESYVKVDQSGVRFYSQAKIALDMIELGKDETLQLINELRQTGGYDYLILDMDFGLDQNTLAIYREAHSVVLVGDGSAISTRKTERAYAALATLEQYSNDPLSDKMCYANNKGNPSQTVNIPDLRVIGSAPAFQGVGVQQMLSQMSMQAFFENIL